MKKCDFFSHYLISLLDSMMNWKWLVVFALLLFTNEILCSVKNVKDEQKMQRNRPKPNRRVRITTVLIHDSNIDYSNKL